MSFEQPQISQENVENGGLESENIERVLKIYQESVLGKMLDSQKDDRVALFTDIDNTFARKGFEGASLELEKRSGEESVPIVAVTGNYFSVVMKRILSGELPPFQAIASSVGTEIWLLKGVSEDGTPEYVKDTVFQESLEKSGYVRNELVEVSEKVILDFEKTHPDWKFDFQSPEKELDLKTNPDDEYRFKISFFAYLSDEDVSAMVAELQEKFPKQQVVVCEEINYNKTLSPDAKIKKFCIDILPITKAGAVRYMSKVANVDQGLVAGDSGNDIDMLLNSGELDAVLVGGYKQEAKDALDKTVIEKKGKRSFRKVVGNDGRVKSVYIEQGDRVAAESILRSAEILKRAKQIKKIKNTQSE